MRFATFVVAFMLPLAALAALTPTPRQYDSFSFAEYDQASSETTSVPTATIDPLNGAPTLLNPLAGLCVPRHPANVTRNSSLPEFPTAYIDRSSLTVNGSGVLVHYISNNTDYSTATQAIIVIHGCQRDAGKEFAGMQAAVNAANKSDIVIMAVRCSFLFSQKHQINKCV